MAGKIDIQFNSPGFKQILESDGVKQLVEEEAKKIAQKANANLSGDSEGFEVKMMMSNYGGGRWKAKVVSMDYEAAKEEAENKVLSSAVK